jgi:hypothetical protein
MIELMGLAGIIVFFAGLHVLWQAREEILYWMQKYLDTFQKALRATAGLNTASTTPDSTCLEAAALRRERAHTMRMIGGFGLLLLGPLLVLLSLFLSL